MYILPQMPLHFFQRSMSHSESAQIERKSVFVLTSSVDIVKQHIWHVSSSILAQKNFKKPFFFSTQPNRVFVGLPDYQFYRCQIAHSLRYKKFLSKKNFFFFDEKNFSVYFIRDYKILIWKKFLGLFLERGKSQIPYIK